jgi:hypothetical protein
MRMLARNVLVLMASPAMAQQVADCDGVPPVTELVEPWEETSVALGAGAIRLALLHGEDEEGVRLLVLTLPPVEEGAEEEPPEGPPPAPERRCRIVAEGGLGFAVLEVGAAEVAEDPEAATLTARLPALRFVPESTELEELTLVLAFGVGDDSLAVTIEGGAEDAPEAEEAP